MRNIAVVVDRIMAVTPAEEVDFRRDLKTVTSDRWKPPELLWYRGALVFHDRFGDEPPTEGWGKQALDIWMGKDVEGEEDGIGGAVIAEPSRSVSDGTGRFLLMIALAAFLVLLVYIIGFYLRARS
jgi:hypothetical protein